MNHMNDKLANELMMLGAVTMALAAGGSIPAGGGSPPWVTIPDLDALDAGSAYIWVRTDFLKSRYRLTVTLDPEDTPERESA
jgi:hypothetical protein